MPGKKPRRNGGDYEKESIVTDHSGASDRRPAGGLRLGRGAGNGARRARLTQKARRLRRRRPQKRKACSESAAAETGASETEEAESDAAETQAVESKGTITVAATSVPHAEILAAAAPASG